METESRSDSPTIKDFSQQEIRQHQFFQLIHSLLLQNNGKLKPGGKGPFKDELIRFRGNPSLGFPASDIESLAKSEKPFPEYTLTVNNMSLYGSSTPLPVHYTEALLNDVDEYNMPRHFLDLFNHRLVGLFYRAWDKYKYTNHYRPDTSDQYSRQLLSLMGLGHVDGGDQTVVEWNRLLPVARLLSGRNRSATAIEKTLAVYFGVHCNIEPFIAENVTLEKEQQTLLGRQSCTLGESAVAGKTMRSSSTRFRIHIGPLDYETYLRFLPGKQWYFSLRKLIKTLLTDSMSYDIWIKVRTDQVPFGCLSSQKTMRLGLTTWLGQAKGTHITIKQTGCS